jgi:DNA repair exonuclease SbcCD ATPase subunit
MSTSEVSADGVMVVHGSNGDESYEITKIPPPTAYLVQNAKKDILQDLSLRSVLTNLNRASDLLYLAYLGVIGTGDLHARISTRQKELCDLCGQCVVTMTALRDGSRNVLDRLTEAYSYLLEANEKRALRILSRCAANAHTMATNCEELARKFGKLKNDTMRDAEIAATAWKDEDEKIKEFEKFRAEMQATFKKQEILSSMLNANIEEMKTEIAREEAKEEEAETRAFVTHIVGAVSGAIGSGLGVYASSMVPVKINLEQGSSVPAGAKEASGDARPNREELTIRKEDKADAQKVNEEAKMAETKARGRHREAKAKVVDAKTDKKVKQKLLKAAKATNTADAGHEEKVREAQTAFDASSMTLSKLQEEERQAEEDLALATQSAIDAKAALDAVVATLDNIVSTANKMSQQQADRATIYFNNRIEMVKHKRALEEQHREAIGQLASLTSQLESNKNEINMEKSAQTALFIATWAFANIDVSLSNAKYFWDGMKRFCDQLADSKTIEQINDEIADDCTPEERIKFYKSPRFVSPGITYISKWTALGIVCDEYVVASQHARKSVLDHIKASPNVEKLESSSDHSRSSSRMSLETMQLRPIRISTL